MVFGVFFAMVMFVMIGNHLIEQRFIWSEFRDGAVGMLIAVGLGFSIDLLAISIDVGRRDPGARERVLARWGLFWAVGFFGTAVMLYTGRASFFLGLFAGLKLTWEVWGTLARMFGWRSMKDRESAPQSST